MAAAVVGGTASELSGGKFANGARSAAFLYTLRELPSLYEEAVGYELDGGPGGSAVQKGPTSDPVKGANNWGKQGDDVNNPCRWCEGGPVSLVANRAFGQNALSGAHDTILNFIGNGMLRGALNFPTMPPAAAFTYLAFGGQSLMILTAQQTTYLSVIVSSEHRIGGATYASRGEVW